MRKNLLLLAVSTFLTLAVFEVLIRREVVPLPDHMESSGYWEEYWQRHHMGPQPREIVKVDPDLGWIPGPNLDRFRYEGAELSTNSRSFRGPSEYTPKKSGKTRIVTVGDSFMFGQCLDDDETITAQLERLLPDTEVINLGVMGYGHGQMLLRLRRDGFPLEPDLVLLGFFKPDLDRNRLTFRDYGKPRLKLDELKVTNQPVKQPEAYERELRFPNYLGMFWDSLRGEARELENSLLALAITRAMSEESQAAGARFAVVYFPRVRQVEAAPIAWPQLERLCEKRNLQCIGPGPRIHAALPDLKERKRHFKCHYGPVVARLIAEETAEQLLAAHPDLFAGSGSR